MDHSLTGVFMQVGDAFKNNNTYRELKLIASDPKEAHTFKVTNYSALDGLLSKLQQHIVHMEGEGSHGPCENAPAFSRTSSSRPPPRDISC
jgi:hypothetical protein